MEINCRFLVNRHGDLYFLVHNSGALITLFMLRKLKEICSGILKYVAESVQKKSLVNHTNYDPENKDSRNVLNHCRLKEFDCPVNYI